ncbi:MAG: FAD-binding oxidoreductase [Flavobacteriales bacterium]|mgnify:FL=1|nr:FAD-binding oxidoreductase [Flavobacteriales bacterium]|tara:strand:+ start:1440 stop:2840 length:1401 start_codon:yes stop_codon:yes gene_type:complete
MTFKKIDSTDVAHFGSIVGVEYVLTDSENLDAYSHDETEDLRYFPEVVLKPNTTDQVAAIMLYCNRQLISVTPCGARTGLSGGSLPVCGGVALSTERFNSIIEIDERNLQATVEPGVINQIFQEAVQAKGLYYPPDPASKGSCFLGGNLAENSGGPKALKYGVTKDYVLNLEVVLPSGDIIWTGANVLKNSTGYNLTQLMVGSEGTLGIITKIVFRLIPYPTQDISMLVPFRSSEKACEAVSAVFRAGITPSALEFMERDAIDWTMKFADISVPIEDDIQAHLLLEVDGNDMDVLFKDCERIATVMEEYGCSEILFADSASQKDQLWRLRRAVGEAVKSNSIYKEEDTVVPRAELPKLLRGVKKIGEKHGFSSVCYGHAGDGNLHINIVKGSMSDEAWKNDLTKGIRELFELTVSLGGTLSGEHGIGLVQKEYMDIAFSNTNLELQKGIKNLFDPNGILNPKKVFL